MNAHKIILLMVSVMICCACNKLEEDGNLPGMWQLMSIERKGNTTNVKPDQVYWSERLGLLQLTSPVKAEVEAYYAHTRIDGDSLRLTDFCLPSSYTETGDDNRFITMDERQQLFAWGIYARKANDEGSKIETAFRIETMTKNRMVLRSDSSALVFRKY